MLETLVNFDLAVEEIPDSHQLLEVECKDGMEVYLVDGSVLEGEWQHNRALTRRVGTDWLKTGSSALLQVPSAVVPMSYNYLLNPLHPDAADVTIRS